ncbi:MAG: glycosyltransferase [Egibacteraceae bacterium]
MILVTVGTHTMPFDRLLGAVDQIHAAGMFDADEVVVQAGTSTYRCRGCRQFAYCTGPEFAALLDQATLVISHGGIGTLLRALRRRKRVIAIPRLRRYGEHHNNHQVEICTELARQGALFTSLDVADLPRLLACDPAALRPFDPPSRIVDQVRAELVAFQASLQQRGRGS